MSKLDRALVGSDQLEDPRLLDLSRGVRLLHVEAVCWSAMHKTDGALSRAALRRLTDEPDLWTSAAALTDAGLWRVSDSGWQIVDWERDQMTAAQIARIRDANRERQERWTQCRLGDHSKCRHNDVRNGVGNDVDNERLPDSTRSDSTRLDAAKPHIESLGQNGQHDLGRSAAVLCSECGEKQAEGTWQERPVCGDCHIRLAESLNEDLAIQILQFDR